MQDSSNVTLADAIAILKALCGTESGNITTGSDINGNKKIGLEEAVYILQAVADIRN